MINCNVQGIRWGEVLSNKWVVLSVFYKPNWLVGVVVSVGQKGV